MTSQHLSIRSFAAVFAIVWLQCHCQIMALRVSIWHCCLGVKTGIGGTKWYRLKCQPHIHIWLLYTTNIPNAPFGHKPLTKDKVITTMVIGPFDDHTYCARSVFTHLGLWWKLYDCSWDHFTARQFILKCRSIDIYFWQPPTGWLKFEMGTFRPSVLGIMGWGMGPFNSPPMSLSLAIFELFSWLQMRFRLSDRDTMSNTALEASYRFVERQKAFPTDKQITRCCCQRLNSFLRIAIFGHFPSEIFLISVSIARALNN